MNSAESYISKASLIAVRTLFQEDIPQNLVQIQITRKEFKGDYTLITFPFTKIAHKSPDEIGRLIGEELLRSCEDIAGYNVIKGYLNIELKDSFWIRQFNQLANSENFLLPQKTSRNIMIEYSSPNTNKPLHLGHVRNNLLGYSVAQILSANGHNIIMANLVNDRGIHICKSMVAWLRYGEGETPQSSKKKGDHLVGDYYVCFDKHYKEEIKQLMEQGKSEDEAKAGAPIMLEAAEMLRKWEKEDPEVRSLWKKMNGWVYEGFDETYEKMGIHFDKVYYESQTYLLGKSLVEKGLRDGVFYRRDDGSVWIDLRADGLDEKLLLRRDGTSVYMTQDLGTALTRVEENSLDEMIYVVGNEQDYHFQVLKLVLKKLGYSWSDYIHHLSYGMVELPNGKMKSREGTVVDADELIEGMVATAREMSEQLGKLDGCTPEEIDSISRTIGLGALKYFILKVDPKKKMLFNPEESIDFNGNTGPFIQYTYARIRSILRKAGDEKINANVPCDAELNAQELSLIKMMNIFPDSVQDAGKNFSPAIVAAYAYELAKEFNAFYHDNSILSDKDKKKVALRISLAREVSLIIQKSMSLLGIMVPERM
ncbi:MAG: arginine--tRNA ligase [Alistipes sp.]|nr:arginine--tRNA ligase [Candidatus Alistipes equi]